MVELVLLVDRHPEGDSQEIDWLTASQKIQPHLQTQLGKDSSARVKVLAVQDLTPKAMEYLQSPEVLLCPLTHKIPSQLHFSGKALWQRCGDWERLSPQITAWGYTIGQGQYWLPIVLTTKGPLYAEVIGAEEIGTEAMGRIPGNDPPPPASHYIQPVHLSDAERQPLYAFGFRLLRFLSATPGTYFLQFGRQAQDQNQALCFERLWPFPIQAAIASLGVQTPDLFTCHGRCLIGLPILDLQISGQAHYRQFSADTRF
jgi:hypothetical protein